MGKRCIAAIIDDGVNENCFNIGKLLYNIEIDKQLSINIRTNYDSNLISHGTICAAIIRKYTENIELISIKILNNNKGNNEQLIAAISWCIENKVKLINISLGTIYFPNFEPLSKIIKIASDKGIIIVAACNNNNIFSIPAALDNVIGVRCDNTETLINNQYLYNNFTSSLDGIDIIANGRHKLIDDRGITFMTPISNSFAAPVITAEAFKLIEKNPNATIYEVREYLKQSSFFNEKDVYIEKLISKSFTQNRNVDIPIICVYETSVEAETSISLNLCAYFRNRGFNAVCIAESVNKSNKNKGIISYKEYEKNQYSLEKSVLRKVHNIYNSDILIVALNEKLSYINEIDKYYCENEADIKVLVSDDISKMQEKNINDIQKGTLLIYCDKEAFNVPQETNYMTAKSISELFNNIIEIFEANED